MCGVQDDGSLPVTSNAPRDAREARAPEDTFPRPLERSGPGWQTEIAYYTPLQYITSTTCAPGESEPSSPGQSTNVALALDNPARSLSRLTEGC